MNNTVFNISQIFAKKGVKRIVLSPGSRNAPLTLSFARNREIETYNIVDERSAGFIGLGMALKSKSPVALCCTSGSAMLNYLPAVSEAYYNSVPLIIVTADRPPEWLDQRDGQVINQTNALANFVKSSFSLPVDLSHEDAQWEFNRKVNEAINLSMAPPFGPVHINVPFREPFYPSENVELKFDDVRIIHQPNGKHSNISKEVLEKWKGFKKKLIVIGQHIPDDQLNKVLDESSNSVIVTDITSNVDIKNKITVHDLFLANINEDQLQSLKPDLLITTGKSLISKNLKNFLRKYKPEEHWHFEDTDHISDTFKTLTHQFKNSLSSFLEELTVSGNGDAFTQQIEANYLQNWEILDSKTQKETNDTISKQAFSEVKSYLEVMKSLPQNIELHLANSMAVRYANFFQQGIKVEEVFCNRGTSGIDGSNGTAVGNAIISDKPVVLLTGDLSFFYDRNAFFHDYDLSNLKIVVFNNKGGGIFRLIGGPSSLPELEQHFETKHSHSAKFTAIEYGFDYHKANDEVSLKKGFNAIFKDDKTPKILEVFSEPDMNTKCFNQLKQEISKSLKTQ